MSKIETKLPRFVYGPPAYESDFSPDNQFLGKPQICQGSVVGNIRRRSLPTLNTPADGTLALEKLKQSQVRVIWDSRTGELTHQAYRLSLAHRQIDDLPVVRQPSYKKIAETFPGQPSPISVKRTLATARKKVTTRIKLRPVGDPEAQIPKPASSFGCQENPAAKIPKTGGFGLTR